VRSSAVKTAKMRSVTRVRIHCNENRTQNSKQQLQKTDSVRFNVPLEV